MVSINQPSAIWSGQPLGLGWAYEGAPNLKGTESNTWKQSIVVASAETRHFQHRSQLAWPHLGGDVRVRGAVEPQRRLHLVVAPQVETESTSRNQLIVVYLEVPNQCACNEAARVRLSVGSGIEVVVSKPVRPIRTVQVEIPTAPPGRDPTWSQFLTE